MGGKHCCIVGCHNSNSKTRFKFDKNRRRVSYFSFPGDKEWRSKLIAAVNRSDRSFNPETAHICSEHFEDRSLLFHGKPGFARLRTFKNVSSLCFYRYFSFLLTDFYVPMLVLICMHDFLCGCWYMYWTWLVTKSSISCTVSFTAFLNFITFASTPHHEQSREC